EDVRPERQASLAPGPRMMRRGAGRWTKSSRHPQNIQELSVCEGKKLIRQVGPNAGRLQSILLSIQMAVSICSSPMRLILYCRILEMSPMKFGIVFLVCFSVTSCAPGRAPDSKMAKDSATAPR